MNIYEKLKKQKLSAQDKKMVENIEKSGLEVLSIPQDEEGPTFSFSVGLYDNYQHPEIIIIGVPIDIAQTMINNMAYEIKKGKKYAVEKEYDDILEGFLCTFKKINKKYYKDFFGTAIWYYGSEDFPAIQCVWPDKEQNYPWDKKFNNQAKWFQPVLDK